MSGLDGGTIKDFNRFFKWYYANYKENCKIIDEAIIKLIKKWEKEDDDIE